MAFSPAGNGNWTGSGNLLDPTQWPGDLPPPGADFVGGGSLYLDGPFEFISLVSGDYQLSGPDVDLTGTDPNFEANSGIEIGFGGAAALTVASGTVINASFGVSVGTRAPGTLTVENGSQVNVGSLFVGNRPGLVAPGTATIDGSTINVLGDGTTDVIQLGDAGILAINDSAVTITSNGGRSGFYVGSACTATISNSSIDVFQGIYAGTEPEGPFPAQSQLTI